MSEWLTQQPPRREQPAHGSGGAVGDWIRRHKVKTGLGITGAALAVLVVAAALSPTPGPGDVGYVAPTATPVKAAAEKSTSTTEDEPAETTTPAPKPRTYRGTGDRILKVRKPEDGPVAVVATHTGSSNFQIEAIGAEGPDAAQLLVNEIGRYTGTTLMDVEDGQDTTRIKVTADGSWRLKLTPLAALPKFTAKKAGSGDAVLVYQGTDGTASFRHTGQSNFIVSVYTGDGGDQLVNEIGRYAGEDFMPEGPAVVEITADGRWSIRVD